MNQEELLKQIDYYIKESQDENFDRYLRQMQEIVRQDPQRIPEIREAVERNLGVYRNNMKMYGKKVSVPVSPQQAPGQGQQNKAQSPRKDSGLEFKIGAILSGIGILFVLIAAATFARNFLPDFMQGILLILFFSVLWVVSELGIRRITERFSLGVTFASALGLYWGLLLNYHTYETMPRPLVLGLLVLVTAVAFFNGVERKSISLQSLSILGYFLSILWMGKASGVAELLVFLAVLVVLNLVWSVFSSGNHVEVVHLIQMTGLMLFSLSYAAFEQAILLPDAEWLDWMILLYVCVSLVIFNALLLRGKKYGYVICWICGAFFYTLFLIVYCAFMQSSDYEVQWLMLLGVFAVNIVLCFIKKWESQWLGCYYQCILLAFCMVYHTGLFPGLLLSFVLFGLGIMKIRHFTLFHEFVFVGYFVLGLWKALPGGYVAPAVFAFLLAATLLCIYVPWLRTKQGKALIYTNVSLMGLVLLAMGFQKNYVSYTLVLVMAVAAVLVLWRKKFGFAESLQGMMLAIVITYLILIYRIRMPVVVSILLMVLAIVSIVAGFWRKERSVRIYGLCLSLFVCAKVAIYDYWDLELMTKSLLFLVIGIIAILISVIYGVLESRQQKQKRHGMNGMPYGPYGQPVHEIPPQNAAVQKGQSQPGGPVQLEKEEPQRIDPVQLEKVSQPEETVPLETRTTLDKEEN